MNILEHTGERLLGMSELMEYVRYLSKIIGPRPAGTEEEHQAALYITQQFQKKTGFSANIEEFEQTTRSALSSVILSSVAVLLSIVALFIPAIVIPLFIAVAILAVIYALEVAGHPLLSRVLAHGRSQNVIAKYQPNANTGGTSRSVTRKIIVVAHYDSGHALSPLVKSLKTLKVSVSLICACAMIVLAVLMFVRIFLAIIGGGMLVILNVLTIMAALVALLPLVKFIATSYAPYNEGANNNATGVAALIELATRISKGSISEADLAGHAENIVIHGAEAAQRENLVPEGATLSYEASETEEQRARELPYERDESDEQSERGTQSEHSEESEDRLLAAKAAVAALTGRPVENRVYTGMAEDGNGTRDITTAQLDETMQMDIQEFMVHENQEMSDEAPSHQQGKSVSAAQNNSLTDGLGVAASSDLVEMAPENAFPKSAEPLITQAASAVAASVMAVSAAENTAQDSVAGFQNVPSWFVAAQKNAKRPTNVHSEIHRSRYTEALEHAEQERFEHKQAVRAEEAARLEAERQQREAEARRALEAQAQGAQATKSNATIATKAPADEATSGSGDTAMNEATSAANVVAATRDEAASVNGVTNGTTSGETETPFTPILETETMTQATETTTSSDEAEVTSATATAAEILETETAVSSAEASVIPSRLERLKSLRTSIPSLSGVIRTKEAARKTAAVSVPNPLDAPTERVSAERSAQFSEKESDAPATHREASSKAAGEISHKPEVTPGVAAASVEVDRQNISRTFLQDDKEDQNAVNTGDKKRSSMGLADDFAAASEQDFASNLIDDADNAAHDERDDNYDTHRRYSDYDNAFIDDDDFDKTARRKHKGIFDRFRRNKNDDAMNSPQQWLGVDDDFEARSAGRARGSWESFRQDYDDITDPFSDDNYDDFSDFANEVSPRRHGRHWEGGSYSRVSLGRVDNRSGENAAADETLLNVSHETQQDRFITGEIERIYHFRNPSFNSEIWFVAMGCDNDSHEGVRAFLREHRSELRGSMIIELESLGAGELSVASHEGAVKKVSASTRIKRHTREAVAATGMPLHEVDLSGTDSIASIIQTAGFQSMHLFGAEKGQIAFKDSADDVLENVDEFTLEENIRFVYELLKR